MITTVSRDGVHVPLLTVQTNSLTPTLSPVTPDDGLDGDVTDPVPDMVVQLPVPTTGVFPERAAVVEHTS